MKKLTLAAVLALAPPAPRRAGHRAHRHRGRLPALQLHRRRRRTSPASKSSSAPPSASSAGLTCEFVQNDWESIIPNLTSGNYDVIMAGMSITDEREEIVDFTQNYYPPTPQSSRHDRRRRHRGRHRLAQTGTIQAEHVAESGATLLEFATPEETVAAVQNGEAEAVFADYDYLKPIVDQSGGALVYVGEPMPLGGGMGAAFRAPTTRCASSSTRPSRDEGGRLAERDAEEVVRRRHGGLLR